MCAFYQLRRSVGSIFLPYGGERCAPARRPGRRTQPCRLFGRRWKLGRSECFRLWRRRRRSYPDRTHGSHEPRSARRRRGLAALPAELGGVLTGPPPSSPPRGTSASRRCARPCVEPLRWRQVPAPHLPPEQFGLKCVEFHEPAFPDHHYDVPACWSKCSSHSTNNTHPPDTRSPTSPECPQAGPASVGSGE
jgi:hypothetical protein